MTDVERALRAHYPASHEVTRHTIGKGAAFGVVVRGDAVVFLLGSVEPRTQKRLEWVRLEATADFLAGRDWVDVGGRHVSIGEPGTLDGFLKNRHKTHIANYVAAVLEDAGIVDAIEGHPVQVRLRHPD